MANRLTLYRRHLSSCNYQQSEKVFAAIRYPNNLVSHEPTKRAEVDQDCKCPIVADGNLDAELFRVRYRSLGTSDWATARKSANDWLTWSATTPQNLVHSNLELVPDKRTIKWAVSVFDGLMDDWDWSESYKGHFRVLLRKRLLPWANKHGIELIEALTNLEVATAFVRSWHNLNPSRNRKEMESGVEQENPSQAMKLAVTTRKNELTRFRHFMQVALERDWITSNPAQNIRIAKRRKHDWEAGLSPVKDGSERYGLTKVEYGLVKQQASLWPNIRRRAELELIIPILYYSGLRISDAATLDSNELVSRESGRGFAIDLIMMKTGRRVYVPIPEEVGERLLRTRIKGKRSGLEYFFWTGRGKPTTCIKNFRNDIAELIHRAQCPLDKTIKGLEANYASSNYLLPFQHPASTHSLRHTFATVALGGGARIEHVKDWLGHLSVRVTEKFYSHASPERRKRSDEGYDRIWQAQ